MSRTVRHRWLLTGTLVAESAVHVGGIGAGAATSLGAARDGKDRPLLPGTSLAGAIRAALGTLDPDQERLWGRISGRSPKGKDDGTGEASWVWVSDATAPAETVPEVRESVGIDRIHGVAARGQLFTREVLPIGTCFDFRLRVDDPEPAEHDGMRSAAELLVRRIADLLRGPSFTVGAATTRGLGRVRLDEAKLSRFCLHDHEGMINTLRGIGTGMPLDDSDAGQLPASVVRVTVPWRPHGPLMVQVGVDGDVVDAFPLTARTRTGARLLLPGSSLKGTLRAHAERIVRTVRGLDAPEVFLEQLKATGLAPVGRLFGTAGDEQTAQANGRRGALTARECLGQVELPAELWADVRLLQRRMADAVGNDTGNGTDGSKEAARQRAALKRLHTAVTELNRAAPGMRFTITPHNAVDRWTGGAADSLLFATLEPHVHAPQVWGPIVLEIDTRWLGDQLRAALALLLFLLRDLCDGLIPFGHGTTRGMGALRVDRTEVLVEAGAAVPLHDELHGRSLSELLGDTALTTLLEHAWNAAGDLPADDPPELSGQAETGPAVSTPPENTPAENTPAENGSAARGSPTVHSSPVGTASPAAPASVVIISAGTAQEALESFAANCSPDLPVIGFAYSSTAAPWFRLAADGTPRDCAGGVLDLTGVFELRAFDLNRELRWWHTGDGRGEARELTDETITASRKGPVRKHSYQRLLWGEVIAAEQGWATLFEPRVAPFKVPLTELAPSGAHVRLEAVEYFAEDDYGNVTVVDERLTRLIVKGSAQ